MSQVWYIKETPYNSTNLSSFCVPLGHIYDISKETLLLQGNVQTTKSEMKWECHCLIPAGSLATSAYSTET